VSVFLQVEPWTLLTLAGVLLLLLGVVLPYSWSLWTVSYHESVAQACGFFLTLGLCVLAWALPAWCVWAALRRRC
jgi:hypothetical protein